MKDVSDSQFRGLLQQAREGDEQALGIVLQQYRDYLRNLAQQSLDGPMGARLDPSDIVQQTCLSAIRFFPKFQGDEPAEFLAWLAQIQKRNLHDVIRTHVLSQKRSIGKEQSFETPVVVIDQQASSPSQRLMLNEKSVRLTKAVESLPEDQREAVRLRHLEGLSLAEMGERLNRSERAVAALLNRGIANLRSRLRDDERLS